MSGYRIEVRAPVWGGVATDGRWVPAIAGALNDSGESDEAASTFASIREAEAMVEAIVENHPNEVRLVDVDGGRTWPLAWHPSDMGGGTGDGSPLPVEWNAKERDVGRALSEWLSCGDWGHDEGPDLVTGCSGMARIGFAQPHRCSPYVRASIWVRRSTGDWGNSGGEA